MNYNKVFSEFTKTSDIVKMILEKYPAARDDDFKLYCWVLYNKGISIDQTLRQFCGTALEKNMPAFATITKCRRTLQARYPELRGKNTQTRQDMRMIYQTYNKEN